MNGDEPERDVLSPREIAGRTGFSYHAVLRAIRRGDLDASEPIKGQYRVAVGEYERWRDHPIRPRREQTTPRAPRRHANGHGAGSFDALTAIERTG